MRALPAGLIQGAYQYCLQQSGSLIVSCVDSYSVGTLAIRKYQSHTDTWATFAGSLVLNAPCGMREEGGQGLSDCIAMFFYTLSCCMKRRIDVLLQGCTSVPGPIMDTSGQQQSLAKPVGSNTTLALAGRSS